MALSQARTTHRSKSSSGVANILDESVSIDSIEEVSSTNQSLGTQIDTSRHRTRPAIMLRGACELMAVGHYCAQLAQRVVGNFAFNRDNSNSSRTFDHASPCALRLEH